MHPTLHFRAPVNLDKQDVYAILNRAYFSEDCHEKTLLEQLPRFLEKSRLVVDVGASLGQYTKCASEAMKSGRIVAIEADPIRHEELQRNAALWAKSSAAPIDCLFAAVSNRVGSTTFHTTNSNVSGGLLPPTIKQEVKWQEIEVPAITLETLFENETPDFLKADIEGAELRMLQGATRILGRSEERRVGKEWCRRGKYR